MSTTAKELKIGSNNIIVEYAKKDANGNVIHTTYLGKTATAADSSKLGGVAASSYATTTYVDTAIASAITTALNTQV